MLIIQCSSGDSDPTVEPVSPTSPPAPTPTATAGPTATAFATPTPIPSPTTVSPPDGLLRGGILRIAIPDGAPHSDPHLTVSSALTSWGAGLAYSRLFKFDSGDGNPTVVCDLCESWQQTAPLTFEIQLRDDIRWQNLPPLNGRKLTAHDVVFSLNRQSSATYPNSSLLSNITEITAIGDHEILIRLDSPDSEVLEKLADAHSRIVAREAVEANGDLRRGPNVGSGPWIANEVHSDVTRLIVNPDYYEESLPYLDGLDIQVIPSSAVRTSGMRSKVLDVTQANFDEVATARSLFDEIAWAGTVNPAAGIEIAMNTARSPLDSLAVRKAVLLTFDPGTSRGVPGEPTHDIFLGFDDVSLGIPLLNPDWELPVTQYRERFGDQTRANQLLATSEIKPTDNVVIKVGEFGQEYIDEANRLAEGLASVGIRADVERVTTRAFGDDVWTRGDYDIMVGAPPPVSSTTAYLFAVHHSEGPWNTTGYANPEIDSLIEAQAREYDSKKRGEMLLEIQRLILDGSHRFISSKRTTHWMHWDFVHDFNPQTPRGDTDFLTRVWLTPRPTQ